MSISNPPDEMRITRFDYRCPVCRKVLKRDYHYLPEVYKEHFKNRMRQEFALDVGSHLLQCGAIGETDKSFAEEKRELKEAEEDRREKNWTNFSNG